MSTTRSQDELLMIMLQDQERRLTRLMREDSELSQDSVSTVDVEYLHNVRNVRVSTSQMNTQRAMTVDQDCTVDLDSVTVKRTLKIEKQRMIESDRQRDIRAREQAFRNDLARITA